MFNDPKDEDMLCGILKAFTDEFGPENVVVALPESWQEKTPVRSLGKTSLLFTTVNEVIIAVPMWGVEKKVRLKTSITQGV